MYLTLILLPLLSSLIASNRKCGKKAPLLSVICLTFSSILTLLIFYEVGINNSPVILKLGNWIDFNLILIEFNFRIDSLTVCMFLPIVLISNLIQLYSLEYLGHDPYKTRFFSLLSLFSFTMLFLVSGENLLMIIVGWEGEQLCLKSFNNPIFDTYYISFVNLYYLESSKLKSTQRIGPHNIDVLCVIFGGLLGDGHLEKRGDSYRLKFTQSNINVEFLTWFWKIFSSRGYCNVNFPKLTRRNPSKYRNRATFEYNLNSYSFKSFKWIHEEFYKDGVKVMPSTSFMLQYLSPLALAVLFQSDGSAIKGSGVRIALNNFTKSEVQIFADFLKIHYNLKTSIQILGKPVSGDPSRGYIVYIYKESLPIFSNLIKPYMVESMYFKLNGY